MLVIVVSGTACRGDPLAVVQLKPTRLQLLPQARARAAGAVVLLHKKGKGREE
jgi:hypothetical protein